jgi:hypothetical protein
MWKTAKHRVVRDFSRVRTASASCGGSISSNGFGFNEAEASDLADSDADLGQARHLLATGCSSTLALQILL